MVHIELVTGKQIKVKGILLHDIRHMIMTSGSILKLTMVTSEETWSRDGDGMCLIMEMEEKEQQILQR